LARSDGPASGVALGVTVDSKFEAAVDSRDEAAVASEGDADGDSEVEAGAGGGSAGARETGRRARGLGAAFASTPSKMRSDSPRVIPSRGVRGATGVKCAEICAASDAVTPRTNARQIASAIERRR